MNRSIHDSSITTVEIYTWKFCPFCIRAKALLNEKGVKFTEYSIDGDNDARTKMSVKFTEYSIDGDNDARTKMSERAKGHRTVPQIFINGKSIGGCDELYELERNNELNALIGLSD